MNWRIWEWFGTAVKPKARKPRATMGRINCPGGCGRMIAFSSHTMLTAPHNCKAGPRAQVDVLADLEPKA